MLAFIRSGLDDVSVSRSTGRARGWGVPVPGDESQVVYVWFDALTNYISGLGYGDPGSELHRRWWVGADERVHVIGKGILRFHAIYWPAFLASAGEPVPTHIRVHPYLTVGRAKLSKSSGVSVDPAQIVSALGVDALRWWFARDVSDVADTDFTVDRLITRTNEDLAGGIGNVVSRIVALVHRHRDGRVPSVHSPVVDGLERLPEEVREHLLRFELRRATGAIVDAIGALNQDIERTAPWKVAENAARAGELDELLARHVASARTIAAALEPIVPGLSARAQEQLASAPRLPPALPLIPRRRVREL